MRLWGLSSGQILNQSSVDHFTLWYLQWNSFNPAAAQNVEPLLEPPESVSHTHQFVCLCHSVSQRGGVKRQDNGLTVYRHNTVLQPRCLNQMQQAVPSDRRNTWRQQAIKPSGHISLIGWRRGTTSSHITQSDWCATTCSEPRVLSLMRQCETSCVP